MGAGKKPHGIDRVLKPGGGLAIIEFKKVEDSPGPPLGVRLSPEETEEVVGRFGFMKERVMDLGPFHYLLMGRRRLGEAHAGP